MIRSRASRREGFSVLEALMTLTILALAAALIMPSAAGLLDRMTAHAVFFEFQRQVTDLRRQAYAAQTPVVLVDAGRRDGVTIDLRSGWSYRLDRPMTISAGGACRPAEVLVLKSDRPVMRLVPGPDPCRFVRTN